MKKENVKQETIASQLEQKKLEMEMVTNQQQLVLGKIDEYKRIIDRQQTVQQHLQRNQLTEIDKLLRLEEGTTKRSIG